MHIGLVGSYDQHTKRALDDLLFTPEDLIGKKSYRDLDTLLNDRRRPDLDLVVLMEGARCDNLSALQKTLMMPVLCLSLGSKQTEVYIESHIAIVKLTDSSAAKDQRVRFAMAATRRQSWQSKQYDWPVKLVPREYLTAAPHPRP
ncbi:MAG: hypothetical protein MUF19_00775 [Candidatus Pacebacteria bacterium]|jgi:hypothetical protein|nr:hypothetical protein [Candidatus Paceibacterota bacterium]